MFCTIVLQTTSVSYIGGNHLSTNIYMFVLLFVHFLRESAPTIIWVSRSWGLPRSTLFISEKATSLWHFQGIHTISMIDLGVFPAVSFDTALAYDFARHEHYRHLSQCEHGLSSTIKIAAITRTLLMTQIVLYEICYAIAMVFTRNLEKSCQSYSLLPKTCFSRFERRFKISKFVVPAVCGAAARLGVSSACFFNLIFSCCSSSIMEKNVS